MSRGKLLAYSWKKFEKLFEKITDNRSPVVEDRGVTRLSAFWNSIDVRGDEECWYWLKYSRGGYGYFRLGGQYPTHRLMWMLHHKKSIPAGKEICHTCDNTLCVNPKHLYIGTHSDNMKDRRDRNRQNTPFGSGVRTSSLTDEIVCYLRTVYPNCDSVSKDELAKLANEYGVRPYTIYRAIANITWKHV
jgi:hypothetical protein